jgi:hypothetical protein
MSVCVRARRDGAVVMVGVGNAVLRLGAQAVPYYRFSVPCPLRPGVGEPAFPSWEYM